MGVNDNGGKPDEASQPEGPPERVDAIVVGGRCAGSATATALARAGRRVVVLEKAHFPSNTLSTHTCSSSHVAEMKRLGALERLEDELDPPRMRWLVVSNGRDSLREPWPSIDGVDYGLSIARTDLDLALAETARDAGADVRERSPVHDLVWEQGRVAGVRYKAKGEEGDPEREIRAPLVVGADGRTSKVAKMVGAAEPYRGSRNGRGFAYWYMDDPKMGTEWREIFVYWYVGDAYALVCPMPRGRMIVQYIGPAGNVKAFREDPEGAWERWLRRHRRLADRTAGTGNVEGPLVADDLPSFFRFSSGPGWALTGDAGHFKDPTIGQGIRDALRFGRLLGEAAAPVLDEPAELDRALEGWERRRDRECVSTYHWGNRETRVRATYEAVRGGIFRSLGGPRDPRVSDVVSRVRDPEEVISPRRSAIAVGRALLEPGADRARLLRFAADELRGDRAIAREKRRGEFRFAGGLRSEHEGWRWPPQRGGGGSRSGDEPDVEHTTTVAGETVAA